MRKKRLSHILLDLDNTLYPASSGLLDEIGRRISLFVAELFDIPLEEARVIRREYRLRYGTTLTGLLLDGHISEPEEYLERIHPTEVDRYLGKDPRLKAALEALPVPCSILTNSPLEHVKRVLSYMEVEGFFDRIFDLRYQGYRGKPSKKAFVKVLKVLNKKPEEVLLVDDQMDNIRAFEKLGGQVLLVNELLVHESKGEAAVTDTGEGIPQVRYVRDLPVYLSLRFALNRGAIS